MSEREPVAAELARTRAEALTTHYQKSYELVLRFWDQRNKTFLVLVFVLGAAALLTVAQDSAENALLHWLKQFNAVDPKVQDEKLQKAILKLPVQLLIAFLVVAVFYLMANLYHRSTTILNYYIYLGLLEGEIRRELKLGEDYAAFTRESTFYGEHGQPMSSIIGMSYKSILLALLVAFFSLRLLSDWPGVSPPEVSGLGAFLRWGLSFFLFPLDVIVAILTARMFWGYATQSAKSGALPKARAARTSR